MLSIICAACTRHLNPKFRCEQSLEAMPSPSNDLRLELDDDTDDFSSTELLLKHSNDSEKPARRRRPNALSWRTILLHGTAMVVYGLLALTVTAHINRRNARGQGLTYCQSQSRRRSLSSIHLSAAPANEAIKHETSLYNPGLKGDPEYFGPPSDEIDKKWSELMWRQYQY